MLTLDGNLLVIPNSYLVKNMLINLSVPDLPAAG
ncbi:MAG: mechanosensitive ion channel family protein [Ignavibacteriales bacterium]|nr:mechanosensitive ion channel family protein [Ignavibacteriales bacterium]